MARRKDHSPEALKHLIRASAEKIIESKGLKNLTARALAQSIGYTPGTIYNFYKDMDALLVDINYATLDRLHTYCHDRIKKRPLDFSRVRELACAYVDFAHENTPAWETLFTNTRKGEKATRLPKYYQERLVEIFSLIEVTLQECLKISTRDAPKMARLLWACLHGITVLTLDGRLTLIGTDAPHRMIDDLLQKYLGDYL
jgi:AcrR family transcriptional regulator